MKNNYTQEETEARRIAIRPIVEGAFGIRGTVLSADRLDELTIAWEMAFAAVPTIHLRELMRLGIAKRCTTAEQFANVWDMRNEALAREMEFKAARKKAAKPKPERAIPDFIRERWEAEVKAA